MAPEGRCATSDKLPQVMSLEAESGGGGGAEGYKLEKVLVRSELIGPL